MTKRGAANRQPSRAELETLLSADLRAITAQSDRVARYFARQNDLTHGDLHALLHVMVAETGGKPLSLAQLSQRLDVSAPAVTYLVDRMIAAGHVRREPDPEDRRKTLLRYEDTGMALAREFFSPLGTHLRSAIGDLSDRDLRAAHRVFTAMITAMSSFENELSSQPIEPLPARSESRSKALGSRKQKPSAHSK